MKQDGQLEQQFFFGSPGELMWGALYLPTHPPVSGWLLCPPLGEERGHSQRIMVEWARTLASQDYAVLRFDYRGSGNSPGAQPGALEDYIACIEAAVRELKDRAGVARVGIAGLRLGATLAVMASADLPGCELLLWEPIEDGILHANELLRMSMVTQMSHGGPRCSRQQLREMLSNGRSIVARGHVITGCFLDSLEEIDLGAQPFAKTSRALVVGISSNPERRHDLKETFRDFSNVQVCQLDIPPPWTETNEYITRPRELFDLSLDWVKRQLGQTLQGPEAAPEPPIQPGKTENVSAEDIISFDVQGNRVWGVLHRNASPDPARPLVVLPWITTQLYVRLARHLAQQGYNVLRFDPRGKGDSEGNLNFATLIQLWNATERGLLVADSEAALDYAAATLGTRQVVMAGVCGDAITATILGAKDPRVVGIILLELPMLYTPPAGATQTLMAMRRALLRRQSRVCKALIILIDLAWKCNLNLQRMVSAAKTFFVRRLSPFRKKISWNSTVLGAQGNETMLDALVGSLDRGAPALCIFAPRRNWMLFQSLLPEFKKISPNNHLLEHRVINGADHVFSLPEHMEQVGDVCVQWLSHPDRAWNQSRPSA